MLAILVPSGPRRRPAGRTARRAVAARGTYDNSDNNDGGNTRYDMLIMLEIANNDKHAVDGKYLQLNRNPRPQLEPQITSLDKCNMTLNDVRASGVTKSLELGSGVCYSIGEDLTDPEVPRDEPLPT